MKHPEKPTTSSLPGSPAATDVSKKNSPKKPGQDASGVTNDNAAKTDRPGFDLGGASDDTHAGTGLGLGNDAFDTAGDRRLPGRRLDNELTIPRWSGPDRHETPEPAKKPSGSKNRSAPQTKKDR